MNPILKHIKHCFFPNKEKQFQLDRSTLNYYNIEQEQYMKQFHKVKVTDDKELIYELMAQLTYIKICIILIKLDLPLLSKSKTEETELYKENLKTYLQKHKMKFKPHVYKFLSAKIS